MDKMEELKKLISSLLVSSPLQMTVMKLDRDYAEQIGCRIPFKKFGFATLEDCLHAMPDVLELRGTGYNAEVCVKVSSKAAHIDKLICKQKTSQPKGSHFGTRSKPRRPAAPRRHSTWSNSQSHHPVPPAPLMRALPMLPRHHRMLPPSNHIQSLFSTLYFLPPNYPGLPNYGPPPKHTQATRPVIPPVESLPKQPENPHRYSLPPRLQQKPRFQGTLIPAGHTLRQMSPVSNSSQNNQASENICNASGEGPSSSSVIHPATNTAIPKQNDLRKNIFLPASNSTCLDDDIYVSDTDDDEYEPYIPELVQKTVESNQLLYSSPTAETAPVMESSGDPILTFSNHSNVPLSVQKNLRLLISKCKGGLWCAQLPNAYLQMFGKELDFMEYKYRSLITMCMELDDIFYTVRPDTGDFKLYDKLKPLPKDCDKDVKRSELLKVYNDVGSRHATQPALPDVENLKGVTNYIFPPDVLNSEDQIPREFIPEDVKEDGYIDVCVGEIYDPSKFWVLLHKNTSELDNLMDEMQRFYTNRDPQYEIPKHIVSMGLYCAAVYNREYHRAIVVNILPPQTNKVKVFYVDYGTVSAVSMEGLYFLHRRFSQIPQQAIRARLALIYPPLSQTQWSQEASSRFLELVKMKLLVAHIYKIDYKRLIVEIFLVDTSGEDDFFVNDALVNEGYAIFTRQEQETPKLLMNQTPRVRHIYLFPTFDEIELGRVPSAGEMVQLTRSGISVQVMYPQYYHQHFDVEAIEKLDALEDEKLERQASGAASWTKLCEEEAAISDENLTETLSELNLNSSPSPPGSSPLPKALSSPEVVYAAPTSRPPPGFEAVQPSQVQFTTTTHKVNVDNLQSTVVTQTANIGPNTNDVLLLNYLLARQQNSLLGSNDSNLQVVPNIANYLPVAQQPLMMPNQRAFALEQSTQNNLLYQLALQRGVQAELQTQAQNYYHLQNQHMSQQQKPREFLQQIINKQLTSGNENLLQYVGQLLNQQSGSASGQEDTFRLLSSIIANKALLIPGADIFSELLNMLSDNQIIELARKANELSSSTLSNSNSANTFHNVRTDEFVLNSSQNSNSCSQPNNTSISAHIRLNQKMAPSNNGQDFQSNRVTNVESQRDNEDNRIRRRCVIQTDLNKKPLHVIWISNSAYVIINEIMQFTVNKAPLEKLRKIIVMVDPSSLIVDLPLWEHEDVAQELSRYQHFDKSSVLHMIPARFIPKIIEILGANDSAIDVNDFLKKVDGNSDLWLAA